MKGDPALSRARRDAGIILEELKDEARWRMAFAKSQDALARLANEARAEIARGEP